MCKLILVLGIYMNPCLVTFLEPIKDRRGNEICGVHFSAQYPARLPSNCVDVSRIINEAIWRTK